MLRVEAELATQARPDLAEDALRQLGHGTQHQRPSHPAAPVVTPEQLATRLHRRAQRLAKAPARADDPSGIAPSLVERSLPRVGPVAQTPEHGLHMAALSRLAGRLAKEAPPLRWALKGWG